MALATRFASPTMNVTNAERVLKNYCKSKGYEKPVYRITSRNSTLLDGRCFRYKHYVCVVTVNGFNLAESDGVSKRIARKKSAMIGLQNLRVYELQNFWQVYRTIVPQGLLKDVPEHSGDKKLMITASAVTIEELMSDGVMTPQSVFSGQHRFTSELDLKKQPQPARQQPPRERSQSTDSSNLLLNAAIEKLKNYKDSVEEGWDKIKESEKDQEPKKKTPAFDEDELHLFNEEAPHHKSLNDIQEIINEVVHEIETVEEKGQDDSGL